jgi:hypothetical protein
VLVQHLLVWDNSEETMKSKLVAFAAFITVMAVLGSFYAKPLLAQVRAALVANIDEPARSPFQVTFNGSCPADSCFLVANPVPPNKRLHITHINAFTTVPFQAQLERVPAAGVSDALAFLPSSPTLGGYVIDANVDLYLDSGEALETFFRPFALAPLFHTATGYLIDCGAAACATIVRH